MCCSGAIGAGNGKLVALIKLLPRQVGARFTTGLPLALGASYAASGPCTMIVSSFYYPGRRFKPRTDYVLLGFPMRGFIFLGAMHNHITQGAIDFAHLDTTRLPIERKNEAIPPARNDLRLPLEFGSFRFRIAFTSLRTAETVRRLMIQLHDQCVARSDRSR